MVFAGRCGIDVRDSAGAPLSLEHVLAWLRPYTVLINLAERHSILVQA